MKTIVLLHSATGAATDLLPLKHNLENDFNVHVFNFYKPSWPLFDAPFSIENFAAGVLEFISQLNVEKVNIIGHRMGGYIGLFLSINYPQIIESLVTIGTKLKWDERTAQIEQESIDLLISDVESPQHKALRQKYPDGMWNTIATKIRLLYNEVGRFAPLKFGDFEKVGIPVLLVLGDRDPRVSFVETSIVYKELVKGQFAVLPNTTQQIEIIDTAYLSMIIRSFLKG